MLVLALLGGAAFAGDVTVEVREEPDGTRTLVHTVDVRAPAAAAWAAFTTEDGLSAWSAPFVKIDLRTGGSIATSYRADAALGDADVIRSRILAVDPGRRIAQQVVHAPPGFPYPDALPRLWSVTTITPLGATRARVELLGLGYTDAPSDRALLAMFREGNVAPLRALAAQLEAAAPPAAAATLADVAWMVGCWRGRVDDGTPYTEAWTATSGPLLGTAYTEGSSPFFEQPRISAEDGHLVYQASPGGAAATAFVATEVDAASVVFRRVGDGFPTEIRYAQPSSRRLVASIHGAVDGADRAVTFTLERVRCPR